MPGFGTADFDHTSARYWRASPTVVIITTPGDPVPANAIEITPGEAFVWLEQVTGWAPPSTAVPDAPTPAPRPAPAFATNWSTRA